MAAGGIGAAAAAVVVVHAVVVAADGDMFQTSKDRGSGLPLTDHLEARVGRG